MSETSKSKSNHPRSVIYLIPKISFAELAKEESKPVEATTARLAAAKMKAHSYHECSAKENRGVDAVFEAAVRAAKEGRSTSVIGITKIKNGCTLL